jgi:hypothetical protein
MCHEAPCTVCRQGDAANAMRWQHNRLVAAGITDKRARHQSEQALRGVGRLQQVLPPPYCKHGSTVLSGSIAGLVGLATCLTGQGMAR